MFTFSESKVQLGVAYTIAHALHAVLQNARRAGAQNVAVQIKPHTTGQLITNEPLCDIIVHNDGAPIQNFATVFNPLRVRGWAPEIYGSEIVEGAGLQICASMYPTTVQSGDQRVLLTTHLMDMDEESCTLEYTVDSYVEGVQVTLANVALHDAIDILGLSAVNDIPDNVLEALQLPAELAVICAKHEQDLATTVARDHKLDLADLYKGLLFTLAHHPFAATLEGVAVRQFDVTNATKTGIQRIVHTAHGVLHIRQTTDIATPDPEDFGSAWPQGYVTLNVGGHIACLERIHDHLPGTHVDVYLRLFDTKVVTLNGRDLRVAALDNETATGMLTEVLTRVAEFVADKKLPHRWSYETYAHYKQTIPHLHESEICVSYVSSVESEDVILKDGENRRDFDVSELATTDVRNPSETRPWEDVVRDAVIVDVNVTSNGYQRFIAAAFQETDKWAVYANEGHLFASLLSVTADNTTQVPLFVDHVDWTQTQYSWHPRRYLDGYCVAVHLANGTVAHFWQLVPAPSPALDAYLKSQNLTSVGYPRLPIETYDSPVTEIKLTLWLRSTKPVAGVIEYEVLEFPVQVAFTSPSMRLEQLDFDEVARRNIVTVDPVAPQTLHNVLRTATAVDTIGVPTARQDLQTRIQRVVDYYTLPKTEFFTKLLGESFQVPKHIVDAAKACEKLRVEIDIDAKTGKATIVKDVQ